jgi:multiple sugar transport system permease protein
MARQLVQDDAVVSGRKRPEAARRPGLTRAGRALRLRPRRKPGLRKTRAWPFLIPVVLWLILMFGYPVIETIRMALSYVNSTNFTTGGWKFAGLANFRALPSLQGWHLMLRNTVIFLVASIVPQFIIGGLLAVALTEKSRLRRWGRSLVLLFASPAGLFDSLYKSLGLGHTVPYFLQTSNDALIVVILLNIWIGIPFNYLVIQSGLQGIPTNLHEAALIDGAGWWKELTRITIPLLRETLLTVLLLGIMGTLNVFGFVWILTQGGPADATMLPGLLAYTQAFVDFNYGQGAAVILGVVVVLLCIAGMFLLVTRSKSRDERAPRARPALEKTQEASA